jgi:hypothetical protein
MAFFLMMVWLVPFGFFISLAANESVLPTNMGSGGGGLYGAGGGMGDGSTGGGTWGRDSGSNSFSNLGDVGGGGGGGKRSRGGLLSVMNFLKSQRDKVRTCACALDSGSTQSVRALMARCSDARYSEAEAGSKLARPLVHTHTHSPKQGNGPIRWHVGGWLCPLRCSARQLDADTSADTVHMHHRFAGATAAGELASESRGAGQREGAAAVGCCRGLVRTVSEQCVSGMRSDEHTTWLATRAPCCRRRRERNCTEPRARDSNGRWGCGSTGTHMLVNGRINR